MEQASLEFETMTDWSKEPPPCVGWWATRFRFKPSHFQPQRRFWDGKVWSLPVLPAMMDDFETQRRRFMAAGTPNDYIEWRGLAEPHPDGYTAEQWAELDACYGGRV